MVFVAEEFCAFVFQGDNAFDVIRIVVVIAPCAVGKSAPHFLAKLSVIRILHEGDVAWVIEGETVFPLAEVFFFCGGFCALNGAVG